MRALQLSTVICTGIAALLIAFGLGVQLGNAAPCHSGCGVFFCFNAAGAHPCRKTSVGMCDPGVQGIVGITGYTCQDDDGETASVDMFEKLVGACPDACTPAAGWRAETSCDGTYTFQYKVRKFSCKPPPGGGD